MNDPKGSATEKRTVVEEGTQLKGSIVSTCPIVVQGSVEGTVDGPAVTVSATGSVSGTIATSALKSAGKISGDFDVETAQIAGSVANNTVVRASALDVKLTHPSGKLQLTFGPPQPNRGRS